MIDCPCGYGKNIKENQKICPACGTDLTPLHRLNALPRAYYDEGKKLAGDNQLDRAIEKLMATVSLDPYFTASYKALGDIYYQKGLHDEAVIQYEKALKLDPENEEIKKAKAEADEAKKRLKKNRPRWKILILIGPIFAFLVGLAIIPLAQYTGKKKEAPRDNITIVRDIKTSLSEEPVLSGLNLEVIYTEMGVAISGRVPSDLHRKFICERARNIAGSNSVDIQNLLVVPLPYEQEEKQIFLPYTVKPGESLILIASRFYGDSRMWSTIYEVNKDKMTNPHLLYAGQILLLPFKDKNLMVIKK